MKLKKSFNIVYFHLILVNLPLSSPKMLQFGDTVLLLGRIVPKTGASALIYRLCNETQ